MALADDMKPAEELLREFEDTHLGEDCPRIDGKIERGIGSKYQRMSPEKRTHHAAIERMLKAESDVVAARAALAAAEAAHTEAANAVAHHDAE